MKRFIPHIVFFSVLATVIIFGIAANVTILASFAGALAAVSLDPALLIGALIIGASTKSSKLLLGIAIPFAILFSAWIANMNAHLGATLSPFVIVVRIVAVVGIAYVSNAIRIAVAGEIISSKSASSKNAPTNEATNGSRALHTSQPSDPSVKEIRVSIDRPPSNDTDTQGFSPADLVIGVRRHFETELLWRLFLVLQSICLLVIVFVDTTNSRWNALPDLFDYRNRFQLEWDFFNGRYWVREKQNWILMLCVLGPYLATKAISWVSGGKASGSETEGEE